MKSHRFMLSAVLMSLSTLAFAQSDAKGSVALSDTHAYKAVDTTTNSDAQKSFETLKTLAGVWTAKLTLDPPMPEVNDKDLPGQVSLRVTSRGNALVHEMYALGVPDDPARYDHPVTMLYVDENRLNLVHYCDAGNRPHMVARTSPNGKTVEFDFADISGGTQRGHMHHAVFTVIDATHHTEDWTYMMPGDKPVHAHFDLQRTK